jgi:hypothetical protein
MSNENTIQPFAEFQALPLAYIISEPLNGAIKAQLQAAVTTREYIDALKDQNVVFSFNKTSESGTPENTNVNVQAPLLAMVGIPHLRIDSLSVNFRYEIRHTMKNQMQKDYEAELKAGTTGWLKSFVDVSLSGSVSSRSGSESETNRSGTLEISLQASESEMPEGLKQILSILKNAISVTETPVT